MDLRIYYCKNCKNKFIVLDNFSKHCIKCGGKEIVKETDKNNYKLYDEKTQLLV